MDDRLIVVRVGPLLDLIVLARDAADHLRRVDDDALASALDGVTAQVATDAHEPARLRDIGAVPAY